MPDQSADPLSIVKKRQLPAVVVLDMDLNVVLINAQAALRVMLEMPLDDGISVPNPLAASVAHVARQLLEENAADMQVRDLADVHLDGEDVYGLKADFLCPPDAPGAVQMVMVQVDTVSLKREVDFDSVRRRWKVSRREQDVLRMLYYGKGNKEIADLLFISEYTVKDHIKAIMAKMGASNRAEVVYKLTTT
jgi:DNA-binding CsgD family transcriptional regulator